MSNRLSEDLSSLRIDREPKNATRRGLLRYALIGSLVIGALGEAFGFQRAFFAAAALSCFSIPIFMWSSRQLAARGTSLAESVEHARAE